MTRTIQTFSITHLKTELVDGSAVDVIHRQAQSGPYRYLLAFADDGLIWGVVDKNHQLILSSNEEAFPQISPELNDDTLWEARLFSPKAEWYVWKTDQGWRSREIADGEGTAIEAFDETYHLWGTNAGSQAARKGFYLAEEIGTGIHHTPPKPLQGRHSLKLMIRHYLDYDPEGAVLVKYSRLVDLVQGGEK